MTYGLKNNHTITNNDMTKRALKHKYLPYLKGKKITKSVVKKFNDAVRDYKAANPGWMDESIV